MPSSCDYKSTSRVPLMLLHVRRPSPPPAFDRLEYAKMEREGQSYHVICGKDDVHAGSEDIFTFISPATEKLEKQGQVPVQSRTAEELFCCNRCKVAFFC